MSRLFSLYFRLLIVLLVCLVAHANSCPARAQTVIHTFNGYADGADPASAVTQGSDGAYYGTTFSGGTNNSGTVFRYTDHLVTLHSFTGGSDGANPWGGVIEASDGHLYGTSVYGGGYSLGVVFKLNTDGTGYKVLHYFDPSGSDGAYPYGALIEGADGYLYGTTYSDGSNSVTGAAGTIFRLPKSASTFTVIHTFAAATDGANPFAGVIQGHGTDTHLYGTTFTGGPGGYGTVYRLSANSTGSNWKVLCSFTASTTDGGNPRGGVIQGTGIDTNLYGTSSSGGLFSAGTVFKVSSGGGSVTDLHNFGAGGSDGVYPYAGLVQNSSDLRLYGTTNSSQSFGTAGSVFSLSTSGGASYKVLHGFDVTNTGYNPQGGLLVDSSGHLWGTAAIGPGSAARSLGSLYTLHTDGSGFADVYDFSNGIADGRNPAYGSLTVGPDGALYGATSAGGDFNAGALIRIALNGAESVLYSFNPAADGYTPYGGVIFGPDGAIYGTTLNGGIWYAGTIWRYVASSGSFSTVYALGGAAGEYLPGGLVFVGSSLFGTAEQGGQYNRGVVFKLSAAIGGGDAIFHIMHSFGKGQDGSYPWGKLIVGSDNLLYGVTINGGLYSYGTVFKMDPNTGATTVLHSFNASSDGAYPYSGLLMGSDGKLYGTTQQGETGYGSIFDISQDGTGFQTLWVFSGGGDGGQPTGDLMLASDGHIYGTANLGGSNNTGTGFRFPVGGPTASDPFIHLDFGVSGTSPNGGTNPWAGLTEGPDGNVYGTTYSGGIDPNPLGGTAISGSVVDFALQLPLVSGFTYPSGTSSGSVSQHTVVTINGANLSYATSVSIGSIGQTIVQKTPTLQIAIAAGTPTGTHYVTVKTALYKTLSSVKIDISP